jgi:3-methylfumaryl-CoA hydratase
MVFVTVRHGLRRDGRLVVEEEQDLVYRSQPAGSARPAPPGEVGGPPPGRVVFELDTDPVLLFQLSALTSNAHRIHYDEPYATSSEGYPGLVVHGPLLALLLLELPRRDGAPVASFAYRLRRPVFAGARISVGRSPSGELFAGEPGAPAAITGVVGNQG